MLQPTLGLVSTALVCVLALAGISVFDFETFAGWVSFALLGVVPTQVMIVVIWQANPGFVSRLSQPAKGAALVGATIAGALLAAPLVLFGVGEGVGPPGPIPSHFAIIVVPITFWLSIAMGGWPFTRLVSNRIGAGLALIAAAYAVAWAIFRVCFDYGFLEGAPVFLATAPAGLFNGVSALVFIVTALAVLFVVLCFDLWPFTRSPRLMQQPILGLVWTLTTLGGAALVMGLGVGVLDVDPMIVLTRVTVPFIFGTILVLNMLQDSLFAGWAQPMKGVLNAVTALVAGSALAQLYGALAPVVTGEVPSGAPGYEYEIWLANALLSVTFPLLIVHAAYFGFWPLTRSAGAKVQRSAAAKTSSTEASVQ